jgi:transcriptional regulator with XRE-family HTH domain
MPERDPQPTFAEVLERLMATRGLSQAKIASALGVYDGNVRRWRTGKGIEIENVWKIADYFGVDRGYLERLAGYGDNSPAVTIDSASDPEIEALLDAERADMKDELRGIPEAFRTVILNAQRSARRVAVDSVKAAIELAQGQPISTSETQPISSDVSASSQDQTKRPRGQKRDLTRGFGFERLYEQSANAQAMATA